MARWEAAIAQAEAEIDSLQSQAPALRPAQMTDTVVVWERLLEPKDRR